jgi:hypothetical protein
LASAASLSLNGHHGENDAMVEPEVNGKGGMLVDNAIAE